MTAWLINGRFRKQSASGVQRVAAALSGRLKIANTMLEPPRPLSGLRGHMWEQFALARLVRDRPLWSPCNTGPVAVRRQVVTIHDAAVFDHPEWFSAGFASFYKRLLPGLAKRCLKIVTVSAFSRARLSLRLGIDAKKIDVVWNGVDEHFHPRGGATVALARAAFGLADSRYFACLSTIEPRKNLQLVFGAWEMARPHLPAGMKLVVIGKKGAASIFRDQAVSSAQDGSIVYTGYVEDAMLPALLSGADALLYPSLYEGFGLPLVEAMACGVPAITTARTSLPEVAADAAIYVDAIDPQDLARQLARVASSAECRREYAGRGLARAKLFSWSDAAARMDGILEALA